jgi:dienelactone hydrolase
MTFTPRPAWTPSPTVTLAPDQYGTQVAFQSEDGQKLVGYFYPSWKPSAPVVILMHEFGNSQAGWKESAIIPWMQNWGALDPSDQQYTYAGGRLPQMPKELSFGVFTFDFRGHGESIPASYVTDPAQHAAEFLMDARAAYAVARTMPGVDSNHLIGIGASIGADAVVDACGEGCSGAFSVSPGNWLKVDYGNTVRALIAQGKPVRCMYAVNDPPSPQTCLSLTPNKLYKIFSFPGIKHGMTFFVPRKMEAGFGANLLEFLQAASQ